MSVDAKDAVHDARLDVRRPPGRQRRHRPDHPGAVPQGHRQEGPRATASSPTGACLPDGSPNADFPLNRPDAARARRSSSPGPTSAAARRASTRRGPSSAGASAPSSRRPSPTSSSSNAMKNGLLPIAVDAAIHARLVEARARRPQGARSGSICPRRRFRSAAQSPPRFDIDPFAKECLVNGVDELGYLLERSRGHRAL